MGLLSRAIAPITRREVYPAAATRLPASETDLKLRMADGTLLRGWTVNPGRPRALVYLGGNGEGLDWLVPLVGDRLPDHTAYLVAYRGYGASEGRPSQPALVRDAVAVLDHAAARHPNTSVDLVGRSLGSGVAVQTAVRRPVGRLVLVTPFDSAVGVARAHLPWFPARWLLADPWDSVAVAHRLSAPTLVVRGGRDTVIPAALTDRLVAALPTPPEVLDLPTRGHDDVPQDPGFWPALSAFLSR
jgi:pimeloyl-ACP methyl ester carboxylesterase